MIGVLQDIPHIISRERVHIPSKRKPTWNIWNIVDLKNIMFDFIKYHLVHVCMYSISCTADTMWYNWSYFWYLVFSNISGIIHILYYTMQCWMVCLYWSYHKSHGFQQTCLTYFHWSHFTSFVSFDLYSSICIVCSMLKHYMLFPTVWYDVKNDCGYTDLDT